MIELCKLVAELESTSSKNDKQAILKKWDGDETRMFLTYALDPYKKFYVRKIPRHSPASKSSIEFNEMINRLSLLCTRVKTGNEAIDLVKDTLESLDVSDGDLFQRILTKDLKCGTNVGIVNKVIPKLIPEFDVQLAAQWDQDKITWPRLCEPKIDGMRALAFIEGPEPDDVVFMSRGGKPIETLGEIAKQLVTIFPVGTILDGEAKSRAGTFEGSMSDVKRKTAKADADIVFTIFDALTLEEFANQLCKEPYVERRQRFVTPLTQSGGGLNLQFLNVQLAENIEDAQAIFAAARRGGYEGLILKDPDGMYDFKRSRTWMKMKPEETRDVEIIGYEAGKRGKRIGKLGAFHVMIDGEMCRVGGGYSDEQISEFWDNRDKMIGDLMEVSFMEKTAKGKTRHCNFVKLRTFKGEKC